MMLLKAAWVPVILLGLFGCSSGDGGAGNPAGTDSINLQITSPAVTARAVDRSLLRPSVVIDGIAQEVVFNDSDTIWAGTFRLPTDRAVDLEIEWESMGFPIARYSANVGPITSATRLSVRAEDYISMGEEFDADGDGFSNLQELNNKTNPADALNIDVRIPRVPEAPGVNGVTGVVWSENIIADWQDNPLAIDNLMIDLGATRADGDTGFYWQAVHNAESLYIIVYAEDADNESPRADSNTHTRDDAINLFIDGDNSKLESYDGLNDFHIVIPFAKLRRPDSTDLTAVPRTSANGDLIFNANGLMQVNTDDGVMFTPVADIQTNTNNATIGDDTTGTRLSYGLQSVQPLEGVVFANGRPGEGSGQPQQVYEIKLDLQQLGISLDSPFGIELQIDTDDDGGNRDARYGWKHPSRQGDGPDVNNTETNPQFMGTAVLQP